MTSKHERKRWKSRRGRRALAADRKPEPPPSPAALHAYARALVAAGRAPIILDGVPGRTD